MSLDVFRAKLKRQARCGGKIQSSTIIVDNLQSPFRVGGEGSQGSLSRRAAASRYPDARNLKCAVRCDAAILPVLGADRKRLAHARYDAIDPEPTWSGGPTMCILAHPRTASVVNLSR
jgi:hypothetical protein